MSFLVEEFVGVSSRRILLGNDSSFEHFLYIYKFPIIS